MAEVYSHESSMYSDDHYPDPSIWKIVTNQEAAEMLQKKLDAIDKR